MYIIPLHYKTTSFLLAISSILPIDYYKLGLEGKGFLKIQCQKPLFVLILPQVA